MFKVGNRTVKPADSLVKCSAPGTPSILYSMEVMIFRREGGKKGSQNSPSHNDTIDKLLL